MKRIKLTTHGPEFSRMVYGTWRLLDTKSTSQEINRRLHACLDLGITTIDTAEIYGLYEVEQLLGSALALSPGLRDKLELVTKAGIYVLVPAIPNAAQRTTTPPALVSSRASKNPCDCSAPTMLNHFSSIVPTGLRVPTTRQRD
jgi:predicted oxidoreductase